MRRGGSFLHDPAALTALWPEAAQAWGRSVLDAFSSVPADLVGGARCLSLPSPRCGHHSGFWVHSH